MKRALEAIAAALSLAAVLHAGAAGAQVLSGNPPAPKAVSASPGWPPPIPRVRILATNILGGSYNSEGIEEQLRLGAQLRLYRSDSAAFRDNFVFLGVNPRLNPTATRLGPSFEIQPLSVFNLKLNVEYIDYFGTFTSVESFPTPLADFGASARRRIKDQGLNYSTSGLRMSITPFVQMKVGPVALRNRFTFEYFAIDLRKGDTVYYEPAFDTLAPGRGTFLSDDLDLFYVIDLPGGGSFSHGRIAAGARYSMFKPLYKSTDYQIGDDPSREHNEMHRVGPLLAFTLFDDGYSRFHEPTIVAMAQWYAAHPNRTGRDYDQAIPYLVAAFVFQSDLWTSEGTPKL